MKKLLALAVLLLSAISLVGCSKKDTLYLLNWGDYMDGELIIAFEKKYNCNVEEIGADSNEEMYNKIVNNAYPIDIAIPSDYMIQKLYKENLLVEIDFSKLENYASDMFDDDLEKIRTEYDDYNKKYAIPYFWGTIGIMYNDNTEGIKEIIENNGWSVFFDKTLTPNTIRVGMYNNPRDSIAAAELYLGYSLNTTDSNELKEVENLLIKQRRDFLNLIYASDDLKVAVAGGKNLDFALTYSGDFFDQYYVIEEEERNQYINFFVPEKTNVYFDAMVIPTTSRNTELAHKFIDFFLDEDNAYVNVEYVGYCPTIKNVYNALLEDEYWADLISKYAFHPTAAIGGRTVEGEVYSDLGDAIYQRMDQIYRNATTAK